MKLCLAFFCLFALGSIIGWILEVIYRRFAKDNIGRKWVNPGFCIGPYLPIYGISLCVLFALANIGSLLDIDEGIIGKIILFIVMAIIITIVEYIAGKICIIFFNVKLWDYSDELLNFQGIVCLKFTMIWWLLSAIYYFFINGKIIDNFMWLDKHLEFSFFVGVFYGIFIIDLAKSINLVNKIKKYAKESEVIFVYEKIQEEIKIIKSNLLRKKIFFIHNITDGIIKEAMEKLIAINGKIMQKNK